MLEGIYVPKLKTKSDDSQSVEKLIILNLAENEPQTKRKTAKAISKYYKSTWDAFKSLEEKKLIKKATTITYNRNEYSGYWLTDEGILMALMEGANPQKMLKQTMSLYPKAKATHAFLEIASSFHPEIVKKVCSSVKGKGKIGLAEVILLHLTQPAIAMDAEPAKKITAVLRKYPDEYSKLKTAVQEMINRLNQLIAE
jgi:hypothetical protein